MEEVGTGLLDHVDAMQRVAASAPPGPLLINAGPGTGKTHVLVRRIAYHVAELHIPASQCLVLAPGSAAAEEIRRQLAALIGDAVADMTIAAFSDYAAHKVPPLGHLFVDDLHLMSTRLYEALRADRGEQPAFTATGDPDSRIDGEPAPFDKFPNDYPDARVVRLSRNHRCTAPIIAAAVQLVTPVTRAPGRTMLPGRSAAGTAPIGRFFAGSRAEEVGFATELPQRLAGYGIAAEDIAVLRADGTKAAVPSMTVSQAAGRQFRVVHCIGVTADAFPGTASARRALFTAMTRARDLLYVSHPDGGSPLLDDIDPGLFTGFGNVAINTPRAEQPRLL